MGSEVIIDPSVEPPFAEWFGSLTPLLKTAAATLVEALALRAEALAGAVRMSSGFLARELGDGQVLWVEFAFEATRQLIVRAGGIGATGFQVDDRTQNLTRLPLEQRLALFVAPGDAASVQESAIDDRWLEEDTRGNG